MQIHSLNKNCVHYVQTFLDSLGCGLSESDVGEFKGRFCKKVNREFKALCLRKDLDSHSSEAGYITSLIEHSIHLLSAYCVCSSK